MSRHYSFKNRYFKPLDLAGRDRANNVQVVILIVVGMGIFLPSVYSRSVPGMVVGLMVGILGPLLARARNVMLSGNASRNMDEVDMYISMEQALRDAGKSDDRQND